MEFLSLLCNDADTASDGKLHVHGLLDELQAPGFPARQDRMVFVAVLYWERDVEGSVPFRIDLEDGDGTSVFTIDGNTDVVSRSADEPRAKTHLVLPLEGVVFPQEGLYRFRISVFDERHDGAAVFVRRTPDA